MSLYRFAPGNIEGWDPDQAVSRGPLDADLDGRCSSERYGVTGTEEVAGEPLMVALAQEEVEENVVDDAVTDDQWLFVEDEWEPDGALDLLNDDGPESDALHVVRP